MLRKRNRSMEKDQQMGHLKMSLAGGESCVSSENHKNNNSFFSVPGLFVGLSPKAKGLLDSDSVRSPTSPLDFRVISNLGNPLRSPKSPHSGQQKSWDTSKVGLSIIDSLNDDDEDCKISGKVYRSESKNILFGPQMRTKPPNSHTHINSFEAPKSLPKNYAIFPYTQIKSPLQKGTSDVVFEIGETPLEPEQFPGKFRSCSLDSCRSFAALAGFVAHGGSSGLETLASQVSSPPQLIGGSPNSNNFAHIKPNSMSAPVGSHNGFAESLSASEIELSEEYTRVISHGPNPKTTHIYGDCILDCCTNDLSYFHKNKAKELEGVTDPNLPYPLDDFLRFCHSCNKKLEGKDIYIYRGEKAFCSLDCRSAEILIDEKLEKTKDKTCESLFVADNDEEFSEAVIFTAT